LDLKPSNQRKDLSDYVNMKKEENLHGRTPDETHKVLDGVNSEDIAGSRFCHNSRKLAFFS
jgi:hypothetical protein